MIMQLPVDLITDILARLPVKTLSCMKVVCKSWRNLISDENFFNCHLERSRMSKINLHYIVMTPRPYLQEFDHLPEPLELNCPVYYSADFDTLDNPIELRHPFKNCQTGVCVVGSCRGLVLLRVGGGKTLLLYNPTTQTYNVLPPLPECKPLPTHRGSDFGFGYDSVSKDYKCVKITFFGNETQDVLCEVMVYSLNANCWRSLSDVPCYFRTCYFSTGILVHEIVHWLGTNTENVFEHIVAFNLRDEVFSCLPLPKSRFECECLSVGMLDGYLCLLANRYDDLYSRCDVWVMKEYGVAGSWTIMFTFEKLSYLSLVRPISYSRNKKRLLVATSLFELSYLDLETMGSAEVTFVDCARGLNAHVYEENFLVLDYTESGDDDSL